MNFLKGGNLKQNIELQENKRFSELTTKFYAAQLLLAIKYLHFLNILHRDIKPENILLDDKGNSYLSDFGLALKLKKSEKIQEFVGTLEYLSPQIVNLEAYDRSADWWSFGCIIYEMLVGQSPFYDKEKKPQHIQNKIRTKKIKLPVQLGLSDEVNDICQRLLEKDDQERLGHNGAEEIMKHKWFADINFDKLLNLEIPPPYKPKIDAGNSFYEEDEVITLESSQISLASLKLSQELSNGLGKFNNSNPLINDQL